MNDIWWFYTPLIFCKTRLKVVCTSEGGGSADGVWNVQVTDFCRMHNFHGKSYPSSRLGRVVVTSNSQTLLVTDSCNCRIMKVDMNIEMKSLEIFTLSS